MFIFSCTCLVSRLHRLISRVTLFIFRVSHFLIIFSLKIYIDLCTYLILGRTGSSLLRGSLSLVAASGGYSLGAVLRLIAVASLVGESGLQRADSGVVELTGLAASRHVGSSQTRDRTCVP